MKVIITGGAGFIGTNAASRFLRRGDEVVIVDNLARRGAERNIAWLRPQGRLTFHNLDIRHGSCVASLVRANRDASAVLHLAAQVAVTTSVDDPRLDFTANALGTLNVLEAVRLANVSIPVIYSSTNKVYGEMNDIRVSENRGRYAYVDETWGISESRPLDFHSPYGCSKGAADQYVHDYHRIFGMNTVVFRQSCIYGSQQWGNEDQGWVAWFMIAAHRGLPLTVYGDGKQVRDILFVDDLIDAFDLAIANIASAAGGIYNVGGGPRNAISLNELISYIERRQGGPIKREHAGWRPGDQRVYISDIRRAQQDLEWTPKVSWREGLDRLYDWVSTEARFE
jgi:CDP-paratose 2-epimerase